MESFAGDVSANQQNFEQVKYASPVSVKIQDEQGQGQGQGQRVDGLVTPNFIHKSEKQINFDVKEPGSSINPQISKALGEDLKYFQVQLNSNQDTFKICKKRLIL